MEIEPYVKERDRDACLRIWEEVNWLDRSKKDKVEATDELYDAGRGLVVRLDGEAECLVLAAEGSIRHLGEDIPFSGVTGVTTSRVARRQGIAARLTARLVAEEADAGAVVSGLGMFEQGFYNRLGFGTGTYQLRTRFDPQFLTVPFPSRPPKRLTQEDAEAMHACRLARKREHGFVSFESPKMTRHGFMEAQHGGFGLGYFDGPNGELTHHFWCDSGAGELGPVHLIWIAYQTPDQFMELMGVIRSLGDQTRLMDMTDPPGIQLQDLVRQPIHSRFTSWTSKFDYGTKAMAWWQLRICDLEACMRQTHLPGPEVRFNLKLHDPITPFLDGTTTWSGTGGDYVVTLGAESEAKPGEDAALPTLETTVNAFSRMWLGAQPPTGLAVTDEVKGPPELIEQLDKTLLMPTPNRDWDF